MAEIWGAVIGGLGVAATVGGSIAQNKANKNALEANKAAQDEQNRAAWAAYLLQRGIMPTGQTQPGVIPQNYQVTNTRLPVWASLTVKNPRYAAKPGNPGTAAPRQYVRRKVAV